MKYLTCFSDLQLLEIVESLLISVKFRVSSTNLKITEYVVLLNRFFSQYKISESRLVDDYLDIMRIGDSLISEQEAK